MLVLAKINALPATTIRYPSISLTFSKAALRNSKIPNHHEVLSGRTRGPKLAFGKFQFSDSSISNFAFLTPNFSRLVYFLLFAARRPFPFLCVLQVQVL